MVSNIVEGCRKRRTKDILWAWQLVINDLASRGPRVKDRKGKWRAWRQTVDSTVVRGGCGAHGSFFEEQKTHTC